MISTNTKEVKSWDELDKALPGSYLITHTESGKDSFIMKCPKCGKQASGSDGHTVENRNPLTVSPSFICPFKECGFHYFVKNGEIQNADG